MIISFIPFIPFNGFHSNSFQHIKHKNTNGIQQIPQKFTQNQINFFSSSLITRSNSSNPFPINLINQFPSFIEASSSSSTEIDEHENIIKLNMKLPKSWAIYSSNSHPFLVLTINRKSRIVMKDAERIRDTLTSVQKNLNNYWNTHRHQQQVIVLLINDSALCSKANEFLLHNQITCFTSTQIPTPFLTQLQNNHNNNSIQQVGQAALYSSTVATALENNALEISLSSETQDTPRKLSENTDSQSKSNRLFKVESVFAPTGDQPLAISTLSHALKTSTSRFHMLRGSTGTGKTYVMAHIIAQVQKPTLILAPNKTLAAQLCNELRSFLPSNAVEFFVSYYNYYRPEAFVSSSQEFIEKSASIDQDVDRLRHSTTFSLHSRNDVVVVASVSCLYGLGSPSLYKDTAVNIAMHDTISMNAFMASLDQLRYTNCNDTDQKVLRGCYRLSLNNSIDIGLAWERDSVLRIEVDGNSRVTSMRVTTDEVNGGKRVKIVEECEIFAASHYNTPREVIESAAVSIRKELEECTRNFDSQGKFLESARLRERVETDLEMLLSVGYCSGIENYSRHFANREAGSTPFTLKDYFDDDFLVILDESHVTLPQIKAMAAADASRKRSLVEFGFRLPSCRDNRPLTSDEFWETVSKCVFVSATPGNTEYDWVDTAKGKIADLVVRPTGVLDPEIEIVPTQNQLNHLAQQIHARALRNEATLVTTITKKLAEDVAQFLGDTKFGESESHQARNLRVTFMHSGVSTLERVEIIEKLQNGDLDVIVGVNLLREGLDLPCVSLVAILDADKQGFLRSFTSLIQTMGRAARHINGHVIMFADSVTKAMEDAIQETERRRRIQMNHHRKWNTKPMAVAVKKHARQKGSILNEVRSYHEKMTEEVIESNGFDEDLKNFIQMELHGNENNDRNTVNKVIQQLTLSMNRAANALDFEKAAKIRDLIHNVKSTVT